MSFSQEMSPEGEVDMLEMTERLIDRVVASAAPSICRIACTRGATRSRPPIRDVAHFVDRKRFYDPEARCFATRCGTSISHEDPMNPRLAACLLCLALLFAAATDYIPAFIDAQGRVFGLFKLDIYKDALHVASGVLGVGRGARSSRRAATLFLQDFRHALFPRRRDGRRSPAPAFSISASSRTAVVGIPRWSNSCRSVPHLVLGAVRHRHRLVRRAADDGARSLEAGARRAFCGAAGRARDRRVLRGADRLCRTACRDARRARRGASEFERSPSPATAAPRATAT